MCVTSVVVLCKKKNVEKNALLSFITCLLTLYNLYACFQSTGKTISPVSLCIVYSRTAYKFNFLICICLRPESTALVCTTFSQTATQTYPINVHITCNYIITYGNVPCKYKHNLQTFFFKYTSHYECF